MSTDNGFEDAEEPKEADDMSADGDEQLETAQVDPTTRRLRVLQNALNERLISEADYNRKKKEILDDL